MGIIQRQVLKKHKLAREEIDRDVGGSSDSSINDNTIRREGWTSDCHITLVSALSVSPAAARYSYTDKRDAWDEHVYGPGLALLQQLQPEDTTTATLVQRTRTENAE